MIRFINRKEELAILNRDWSNQENGFIVVYGRRRIGKTRLLEEFLKNKTCIRYTAEDVNKKIQINELKAIIGRFFSDDYMENQDFSDWSSLFRYLPKVLGDRRIFLWIDEFSYLIKNDPSITSVLQKFIDDYLRNSRVFLIVSGSLFGLMRDKILSSSSPLYGRRTRDILVEGLKAKHLIGSLKMDFEDSLRCYMTIGGIPEYLLTTLRYEDYDSFIRSEFFNRNGYFYREPYFLLSQEFRDIKTYFSILAAISFGSTKPTEIANFIGLRTREIYPYLDMLISYGFIAREQPFMGQRKSGIYLIKDTFFDAWYNLIYHNRQEIEAGNAKIDKQSLNRFFGKRFEIFVRSYLPGLVHGFNNSGHWWHKDQEIDVVATDGKDTVLFGECKWKDNVEPDKIVLELQERARKTEFYGSFSIHRYAVFAKSFKSRQKPESLTLFDLKDMEKRLLQ